ncbi:type II toxin-antitoxin system RelE family toxin [Methanobrevibacter sp.]|uniref:type II toxin-antitoxin system RelE family toxin n=1 Tax=Methanobrevibacter sp. TaxID=66852 RepID=UPI00388F7178
MIAKINMVCPNRICSAEELNELFVKVGGVLRDWEYDRKFFKSIKKIDKSVLEKFLKQIRKIFENPYVGKNMAHNRKGQLELYVADTFRLYYSYIEKDDKIVFLEFSRKKHQ